MLILTIWNKTKNEKKIDKIWSHGKSGLIVKIFEVKLLPAEFNGKTQRLPKVANFAETLPKLGENANQMQRTELVEIEENYKCHSRPC